MYGWHVPQDLLSSPSPIGLGAQDLGVIVYLVSGGAVYGRHVSQDLLSSPRLQCRLPFVYQLLSLHAHTRGDNVSRSSRPGQGRQRGNEASGRAMGSNGGDRGIQSHSAVRHVGVAGPVKRLDQFGTKNGLV